MMETTLIPCPFCGKQEFLGVPLLPSGKNNAKGRVGVECYSCGAIGPVIKWGYVHEIAETEESARSAAAIAWNARAPVTEKAIEVAQKAAERIVLAFNSALALEESGEDVTRLVSEIRVLKSSLVDLIKEREILLAKKSPGAQPKINRIIGETAITNLIDFFQLENR